MSTQDKEVEDLTKIFKKEGELKGRYLETAIRLAKKLNTPGGCTAAYIAGASLMRSGKYEDGKGLMLSAIGSCYGASVKIWGETEHLRTLIAGETSLHAGDRGDYTTIQTLENKLAKDLVVDRLLVRDAKGILQGKTKLADILRFNKARAYSTAKMPEEAKKVLQELEFASGKVFVDGEVTGLQEAIGKLKTQVDSMISLLRSIFKAA